MAPAHASRDTGQRSALRAASDGCRAHMAHTIGARSLPMTMHPFDAAIALAARPEGGWLGHTSTAYGNMVGPFGGITAAQALQTVMLDASRQGEPVALTVNFCAPLDAGEFVATARAVRTNRSTQHWIVELQQQGQTCVSATVFTALRRQTWAVDEHPPPPVQPPQAVPPARMPAPVAWIDRYEMRFLEGALGGAADGAERPSSRTRLWVRDAPPRPLDATSLVALADVFYPRIFRRRARMVPAGTVSMTVHLHADAPALAAAGEGWLLAQAQAQGFRSGYFDQSAQLWSESGVLLATSLQTVYYKD